MSRIDQRLRARRRDPCPKSDQQLCDRAVETNVRAPDSSTVSSQRRKDTPKHQDFAVPAPECSVDWAGDEEVEFDEDYVEQLSGSAEQHSHLQTCRTNAETRLQDLRASSRSGAYNNAIEEQKSILAQIAAYENASPAED
ncbi:hypothetical protein Slin14017_G125120 [Septoria linicola]|nr:hypothetical protein Slin14017_G125120 [Septoria linicola]